MRSFARAPSFEPLLDSLVHGPDQLGIAAGRAPGRITVGWGRQDLVCLPRQAARMQRAFPDARLHWFERCGHFPQWDAPRETVALILGGTG
jgi:pimeloyl-ACP methyl ester carboxylesterase